MTLYCRTFGSGYETTSTAVADGNHSTRSDKDSDLRYAIIACYGNCDGDGGCTANDEMSGSKYGLLGIQRQTVPNHRRRTTGSGCLRMSSYWAWEVTLLSRSALCI